MGEAGPASALRVECVESVHDPGGVGGVGGPVGVGALEAHAAAWDALVASLPQGIPMLSHAWVATHLEKKLRPSDRWLCLFAYDGDELIGVLPGLLVPARALGLRRTRVRVPGDYHTAEGDLVLKPGREAEALRLLLDALRRRVPRLLRLELGLVRDDAPTLEAISTRPPGWAVTRSVEAWGSAFEIRGSVEDWRTSLSEGLRSDMRRGENRVKKEGLGPVEFEFLTGADASPGRLDDLMAIEATGWKGREGVALSKRPDTLELYRAFARRFAERGWLEWHFLALGGRRAAAHMTVRMGRSLMLLRVAYDESLARCSPGNLLLRRAVEREFEMRIADQVTNVTDWPWCRRWRMARRPYERLLFHPLRPLPLLLGAAPAWAKAATRRVPGLPWLARRLRGGFRQRGRTET